MYGCALNHGFQHKTQDNVKVMHCGSYKVKWTKHMLTSVFIIHPLKWYGSTWTYAWPILNIKHLRRIRHLSMNKIITLRVSCVYKAYL